MELFDPTIERGLNYLPYDGIVNYLGQVMPGGDADFYLRALLDTIEWRSDEAVIFGRKIFTKRNVAWYGEKPFSYTYSRTTKFARPWTRELLDLKLLVENKTGQTFNSCLLNLYDDGQQGMAWHSDGEKDLKKNGAIGSLSLGAERKFSFRHKMSGEKVELLLAHGSVLIMAGATQTNWQHRLPPTKRVTDARVNLTFRTIVQEP